MSNENPHDADVDCNLTNNSNFACLVDFEASEINRIKKSTKSIDATNRSSKAFNYKSGNPGSTKQALYNQVNLQYQHKMIDPNSSIPQNRPVHNRSGSNSKLKKNKNKKYGNISINKLKNSYLNQQQDGMMLIHGPHTGKSSTQKSRKSSIEVKMKHSQEVWSMGLTVLFNSFYYSGINLLKRA